MLFTPSSMTTFNAKHDVSEQYRFSIPPHLLVSATDTEGYWLALTPKYGVEQ